MSSDDDYRWRGGREVWHDRDRERGQERNRDPNQYSRYGRDEEWEGRFGPEDYGGGISRGGTDFERGGFQIRGGGGGRDYGDDDRDDYRGADYRGADYRGADSGREDFGSGYGRSDQGRRDLGRGFGQGRGFRDYGRDEWHAEDRGRQARRDVGHEYARDRALRDRQRDDRGFLEKAGDEIASWFGDEDAGRRRRHDAEHGDSGAQHHRGRGPRGYTRSDERIRDDVNDRLTDDAYVDASDIEVTVSGGEVTLTGHVPHRSMKRRAEDLAESVSGVTHVQNNLRAGQGSGTSAGASAMAGMGGSGQSTGSTTGSTTPSDTAKTRT